MSRCRTLQSSPRKISFESFNLVISSGLGPGITPPKALYAPDPDYTERARSDRFQGDIVLGVVVGADGNARSVWVVRPLGEGLDENAVATVGAWKFAPARKNGEPVAVIVNVEVTFRLY